MVLILIVSLLGCYAFRKTLKEKGYSSLLWSLLPILLGLVSIAIAQVAALLVGLILGEKSSALSLMGLVINVLCFVFFFSTLAVSWKRIKALPKAP